MKKSVLLASAAIMMCYFTSCGGGKKTEEAPAAAETTTEAAAPEYKLMTDLPTVDITTFPKDKEGRYVIFDGKTFNGWRGYDRADVPVGIMFMALCGLCTSIMWGGIFNLAVEGLGKYTAAASGIFMVMVCGGGILPLIQGGVADFAGYLSSYWVVVAGLAYMLFYALVGSKNVNKDIPVEE